MTNTGMAVIEANRAQRMVPNALPRAATLEAIRAGDITWSDLARERGQFRPYTASLRRSLRSEAMLQDRAVDLLIESGIEPDRYLVPAPQGYGNGGKMVLSAPVRAVVAPGAVVKVARALGQFRTDPSHLKTMLGVKATKHGRYQDRMDYDTAVWLCRRLEFDPVDWGL